jgi:hypothetical protein
MEIFEVEGVKVVMTHIGGYPGKYAPGIKSRLELSRPKLFVCGHSHILKVMPDRSMGCLVVNPGAAGVQGWQVVVALLVGNLDVALMRPVAHERELHGEVAVRKSFDMETTVFVGDDALNEVVSTLAEHLHSHVPQWFVGLFV